MTEHKIVFQDFKRYPVYLHSTNLKYRIQQQSLQFFFYIYNLSENVKFNNYQRFVERFVVLSDYQTVRLTYHLTNGTSDFWDVGL